MKGRDADFSRKGAGPSDPSACETTSRKSGKVLITFGVMSETGIRYMAELEELIESYRAFAATVTLSAPADRATQRKLLCTNTQNHWPTTGYARRDAPRACPV